MQEDDTPRIRSDPTAPVKMPKPRKDGRKPKDADPDGPDGGNPDGPAEDFRTGEFRCLRCGAAFRSRAALDQHTEKGHGVEV